MATDLKAIAGYELIEWLGDGAFGPIYRARQTSLDRPVIVKLLDAERGADPEVRKHFLGLARPLARVAHTNLLCGLDVGETDGLAWFVMESAEGRSIEDHMKPPGRLPERQSLRVAIKTGRALHAMHQKLVVHKNVRPRSILVTHDGVPKLTDFGLASLESARDLADAGHPSTAWYLSPERVGGQTEGDVASDVYALGATLFHMLVGRPPFEGETPSAVGRKHVAAPPPAIRTLRPEVGAGTEDVIRRCLAKRPSDRFINAGALADALEQVVRAATPPLITTRTNRTAPAGTAPHTGTAPVVRRRKRRRLS